MTYALDVERLSVFYNGAKVVSEASFIVPYGTITAIMGPNGAGKSSLLKGVLGLVDARYAKNVICGIPGDDMVWLKHVAYMPQQADIDWAFPIDVFGLLEMALYKTNSLLFELPEMEKELIVFYMGKIGISHLRFERISNLSGGERQRVLFCRAILQRPDLYVLDEPFIGIDKTTENDICNLLIEEKRKGKAIVIVHHNLYDLNIFDWFVFVNSSVISYGNKEDVFNIESLCATYKSAHSGMFDSLFN